MYYKCMARDCGHDFDIKVQNGKFALFSNCPKCGCVAEFKDGLITHKEMMEHSGYDCIEQRYHSAFNSFSRCPFAYDCYLYDQYITDCEHCKELSHRCLIRLDNKLSVLEDKLDRILAHLHIP